MRMRRKSAPQTMKSFDERLTVFAADAFVKARELSKEAERRGHRASTPAFRAAFVAEWHAEVALVNVLCASTAPKRAKGRAAVIHAGRAFVAVPCEPTEARAVRVGSDADDQGCFRLVIERAA